MANGSNGGLEAWSSAVGEALNQIAGFRYTRLTADAAQGDTFVSVETTLGWDASGKVVIDGVLYFYAGKTPTTLTGIYWLDAGVATPGVASALPVRTNAVDMSRTYSALDAVRAQLFVDTAVGPWLSAVGRRLGVERPPNLSDDEKFRAIIKAIAFSPKGTIHGIELALTAFFGAGNFEVVEDFPTFRNTVFIKLLNAVGLATTATGQAYLALREARPLNVGAKTITVTAPPARPPIPDADERILGDIVAVQGVTLANEDRNDTLELTKPSSIFETRYTGATPTTAWHFVGTGETDVTMDAVKGAHFAAALGRTAAYFRPARILPSSFARFNVFLNVISLNDTAASSGKQWSTAMRDGEWDISVGFISFDAGNYDVGFQNFGSGTFIDGAAARITTAVYHDVEIRKYPLHAELWVDGAFKQSLALTEFAPAPAGLTAPGLSQVRYGAQDATRPVVVDVKATSLFAETPVDFWNTSGSVGDVSADDALDTNSGLILPGDVGKALRTVSPSAPANQNSGQWVVDTVVDTDNVTLTGPVREGAFVESAEPTRVTVNIPDAFKFPDDVGKRLVLASTDPDSPNPGTFTIDALLRAGTDDELTSADEDAAGYVPPGSVETTNICTVTAIAPPTPPPFTTEVGLSWQLLPAFSTEANVYWELVGSGSYAGQVLTMRDTNPLDVPVGYEVVLVATYSVQASAQLLASAGVLNDPVGAWEPLYLPQHPLGPYLPFLGDLTVAGVIPEFILA